VQRTVRIAIGLTVLGWGTGSVTSRAALLEGAEPLTVAAVRIFIGAVLVVIYVLLKDKALPSGGRIWRHGSLLGVLNMGASTMLFIVALQYVSAGYQGLIISLAPVVTAVIAHFMLRDEPLRMSILAGLAVGLAGVALLVLSSETGIAEGGDAVRGTALTIGGVLIVSLGGVFTRRYAPQHRVIELGVPQAIVGTAIGGVGALALGGLDLGLSAEAWWLILYTGVIGTALPFLSFLWASQHASATRVATIGYLIPVISLLVGAVFIDEVITFTLVVGGALILSGVVIVDRLEARRVGGVRS
jgi:drug/metabolite transporter (DMT)-like permease